MQGNIVLSLTGPDRIGIVEEVTGLLLKRGGNVENSRMARLGGAFAVLMLATLPPDQLPGLDADLAGLVSRGYKITTTQAEQAHDQDRPGWLPYQIEVRGADHEGIIHEVARYLSGRGISIESVESESAPAPTSGVPLFSMTAQVVVPPDEATRGWEDGLDEISTRLNLEITASPLHGG